MNGRTRFFQLVELKSDNSVEYLAVQLPHLWNDGICPAAIGLKLVDIKAIRDESRVNGESKGFDDGYEEGYRHATEDAIADIAA